MGGSQGTIRCMMDILGGDSLYDERGGGDSLYDVTPPGSLQHPKAPKTNHQPQVRLP